MNIGVELYAANQELVECRPRLPGRFVPPALMPVLSHLLCYCYFIFVSDTMVAPPITLKEK